MPTKKGECPTRGRAIGRELRMIFFHFEVFMIRTPTILLISPIIITTIRDITNVVREKSYATILGLLPKVSFGGDTVKDFVGDRNSHLTVPPSAISIKAKEYTHYSIPSSLRGNLGLPISHLTSSPSIAIRCESICPTDSSCSVNTLRISTPLVFRLIQVNGYLRTVMDEISGYNGRAAPNVSQYVAGLNMTSSAQDISPSEGQDGYNFEADLAMFTNTQFFDFDLGEMVDAAPVPYNATKVERDAPQNLQGGLGFLDGMIIVVAFVKTLRCHFCSNFTSRSHRSSLEFGTVAICLLCSPHYFLMFLFLSTMLVTESRNDSWSATTSPFPLLNRLRTIHTSLHLFTLAR